MKTVEITKAQYDEFRRLQERRRWDWPATFSTNSRRIWPYIRNGYTPESERNDVKGVSPLLDSIADIYTGFREEGGRFFINEDGALWKPEKDEVQFVAWKCDVDLRDKPPPIPQTPEENRALYLRTLDEIAKKRAHKRRS